MTKLLKYGIAILSLITANILIIRSIINQGGINEHTESLTNYKYIDISDKISHKSWNSTIDSPMTPGVCIEDLNKDDLQDIFIPGTGYINVDEEYIKADRMGNSLFINKANDTENMPNFKDVSEKSGVLNLGKIGVGCAIADYDNDGYNDILVTNATKSAAYSAYGAPDNSGNTSMIFPPDFFKTDITDGKYNFPDEGGVTLFRNIGIDKSGTPLFEDVTIKSGLINGGNGTAAAFADMDNDGLLDLFVGNYSDNDFIGFASEHFGGEYNYIYKNNGNGIFTDVSDGSGIKGVNEFVYRRDGTKQYGWNPNMKDSVGNTVGNPAGNTLAVAFTDYNDDKLQDIVVADDVPGRIRLFENLGNFKFKDVSEENDFGYAGAWMGIALGDINNDGEEEIFATNMGGPRGSEYRPMSISKTHMMDILNEPNKATLYHGLWKKEDGQFKNISEKTNVEWHAWDPIIRWFPPERLTNNNGLPKEPFGIEKGEFGFGAAIFDYNNDGLEDIIWTGSLVRSFIYKKLIDRVGSENMGNPGRLLKNIGNMYFEEVAQRTGALNLKNKNDRSSYQNGRGLAVGDLNNDGYYDIVMTNAGGWDSADKKPLNIGLMYRYIGVSNEFEAGPTFVYISEGGENNWIKIRLEGTKSNKSAIGAKITIEYQNTSGQKIKNTKTIRAGESFASGNSLTKIFGIEKSNKIDKITIKWPSGINQEILNIKANQQINIIEDKKY